MFKVFLIFICIIIFISGIVCADPPVWQPIQGTQYSMVVMAEIYLYNDPFIGLDANMAAAFGPGGESDCRSLGVWQPSNPPYWDGYWYINVVGNSNGDELHFEIYNENSSEIQQCVETIIFQNDTTIGSPDAPYTLSVGSKQIFQLGDAWNWITFNVQPQNPSIDSVFSQLGSFIYQIKNQTQSATYYDPPGSWVGNLTEIIDGSAYLINMNHPVDSFSVTGMPIESITPIQLLENWNWIAYYPHLSQSLDDALSSIEYVAYQIKNQTESATFYDPPGVWVGNLEIMEPNVGYKLNVTETCELIYPEVSEKIVANTRINRPNPPNWQIIPGTQYSMILMAQITYDGTNFEGGINQNMAAAFGPGGLDDCRSIASWQEAFPPYWDGYWYFTIVGNDNGEDITFKIYNSETDSIYNCVETLTFQDNTTIGEPSSPYQLTALPISVSQHLTSGSSVTCYPNPYSEIINFNFADAKCNSLSLSIFDLRGRLIISFEQDALSESRIIQWDATDMDGYSIKPGVYFYQITTSNYKKSGKIVYLAN
ncbi:MAG TPA: T9SS type A sorting domain-containing protein [Candidatus Cloacimonetes bacterium]|nr:T9SS type A sorting domain-containing protein [Candidatus Cloacimonadota bacterium]HEX38395.1 T9SS type A sorting domain-containing protein [Candidatus Cloacimonadota bacterium]